jgi:hypothetical protein
MAVLSLESEISELEKAFTAISPIYRRARFSAMGSLGYFLKVEVSKFILSNGAGIWPEMHPFTTSFRSKFIGLNRGSKGTPPKPRGRKLKTPFAFLSRFSRYARDSEGLIVAIGFRPSRSGQKLFTKGGSFVTTPFFTEIAKRVQEGREYTANKDVSRFWGATKKGRKRPKKGVNFFPLKVGTTITVPPRPIFQPVFNKNRFRITPLFRKKFDASLRRNLDRAGIYAGNKKLKVRKVAFSFLNL